MGEELGITQSIARDAARLGALTGRDPLTKNFAEVKGGAIIRSIRLVGNYGEIYDRYFGVRQRPAITREGSRNMLAIKGGAMASRPFRP